MWRMFPAGTGKSGLGRIMLTFEQKLKLPTLAFLPFLSVLAVYGQQVPAIETNLANGMRLLMVERHDEPSVAGGWVAHVGSANERPGITGIAHLFEHMMFKGTPTIGTKNYQ